MNCKIITASDDKFSELTKIWEKSVKSYCRDKDFVSYKVFKTPTNLGRPAAWFKLKAISECIKEGGLDYVLWIDSDAVIQNLNFNVTDIFNSNKEIYISKDCSNEINAGVMAFKCSDYNLDFLEEVWNQDHLLGHVWYEQIAIIHLINNNYNNVNSNIEYVDGSVFNAYIQKFYQSYGDIQNKANKDSFVIHFPAIPLDVRLKEMKKIIYENEN